MTFQHREQIAATSNTDDLLEPSCRGFAAGKDSSDAFEAMTQLTSSSPMVRCLSILQREAASDDLSERRKCETPSRQEKLPTLPANTWRRACRRLQSPS
jgi:hypothetical protein